MLIIFNGSLALSMVSTEEMAVADEREQQQLLLERKKEENQVASAVDADMGYASGSSENSELNKLAVVAASTQTTANNRRTGIRFLPSEKPQRSVIRGRISRLCRQVSRGKKMFVREVIFSKFMAAILFECLSCFKCLYLTVLSTFLCLNILAKLRGSV